ncbi:MAG TPA: energy transducer TonB, partial [Steroidobacteraceae bacterium]|nr:energy transducer TonB [Steroidobacteraceae bacterium]
MTAAADPRDEIREVRNRAAPSEAVPVLLVSTDPALRAVVGAAIDQRHEFRQVDSADAAVDSLLRAPSGVLITDLAGVHGDVPNLFVGLRDQFPDLVMIAAGTRDDESRVAGLLSDGTLFRFLHKPASPGRISLFIDAAVQRHERASGSRLWRRLAAAGGPGRILLWVLLGALLIAAGTAAWLLRDEEPVSTPQPITAVPTPDENVVSLLVRARTALQQNRLAAPENDNALDLYRRALELDPDAPEALDGQRRVVDALLLEAENGLAARDLDRVRTTLEHVRLAKPDHPRLHFLDAQLARAQAAADAARRAQLVPEVTEEQAELQRLLALADERLSSGRLIGPNRDSASHYVLAARAIDPTDPEVRSVAALTGASLAERGEAALAQDDIEEAQRWAAAARGFAQEAETNIRGLQSLTERIEAAVTARAEQSLAQHLELAEQRLQEAAWIAPRGDSAFDHLSAAREQGADAARLASLEAELFAGLIGATRTAIREGELEPATELLEAAGRLVPGDDTVAELGATLAAAVDRQAFLNDVVPVASLTRTKGRAANYPRDAVRRGVEGYVEIQFTVARDGSPREFDVVEADPPGIFEEAA